MESRAEHLAWCKQRALEYADRGDIAGALASMGSGLDGLGPAEASGPGAVGRSGDARHVREHPGEDAPLHRRIQLMAASAVPPTPRKRGTATTVRLESGGTVTLTLGIDLFSTSSDDRTFVLSLVDQLAEYAKAHPVNVPASTAAEPKAAKE